MKLFTKVKEYSPGICRVPEGHRFLYATGRYEISVEHRSDLFGINEDDEQGRFVKSDPNILSQGSPES